MSKSWIPKVLAAMVVAVPALVVRLGQLAIPPALAVLLFGAAVVASAFLLAWAAETAEVDISASLSTAVLAFIAVLPEYAVDLYFSYTSGHRPEFAQYAAANMTGSNRLLIGIGWPVVVLVFWFAARRRQQKVTEVVLDPRRRIELGLLAMAGLYAFVIPLTRRISLLDSAFLLALFGVYLWRVSKQEKGEPDLVGVAEQMASLPRRTRIFMVILLFLAAAGFILASAAPFADALVEGGKQLGIDAAQGAGEDALRGSREPDFTPVCFLHNEDVASLDVLVEVFHDPYDARTLGGRHPRLPTQRRRRHRDAAVFESEPVDPAGR